VGELSGLDDKAVTLLGDTLSLRIPVGKLHNDRYVPIRPELAGLISDYQRMRGPSRSGRLVERDDGRPFDRRTVHRYVERVAKRAGVRHVHPHQLRHTLATRMKMSNVAFFASFHTVRDEVPPGDMDSSGDVAVGSSRDEDLVGASIDPP
jgi:integrase